jgi:ABC-type proline/glycine betaine transport system substrate-binding protein
LIADDRMVGMDGSTPVSVGLEDPSDAIALRNFPSQYPGVVAILENAPVIEATENTIGDSLTSPTVPAVTLPEATPERGATRWVTAAIGFALLLALAVGALRRRRRLP